MQDENKKKYQSIRLNFYFWLILLVWTGCIVASLVWSLNQRRKETLKIARTSVRVAFEKDIIYRRWNAGHGGVYVPVSEKTPPNPYLNKADRDVTTTSGLALTLMNPAYMTRQAHEMGLEAFGSQAHITSLNPIRPENVPDPWETQALKTFQRGAKEVSSVEKIKGQDYMRLMRPFLTEKSCLKCHSIQGYKLGDIRGGISVSIPMAPLWSIERSHRNNLLLVHSLLWLIGLAGIGSGTIHLRKQVHGRKKAELSLKQLNFELEERIKQRTAALQKEVVERHQAEEQLLKSKIMLQSVFDGISEPLMLLDEKFAVKMLNKTAAKYYQVKRQNIKSKPCFEAFMKRASPCEGCNIISAVKNGQHVSFERKGLMNPDRFEKIFVYPLKNKINWSGNTIIRISDVTEARRMEKRFLQSEKLASLGFLISGVAHEINNPNNFITFNIPILRDYLQEIIPIIDDYAKGHQDFKISGMTYPEFRKDIFKLLENIEHGSSRINTTVSRLKEFSRNNDKMSLDWVDIKQVVEKGVSICGGQIKKMVKTFKINIPESLPLTYTEPAYLEHVIINLLVNAAQAADKKDSWVNIKVTLGDTWHDHLILEVSDNGCGMDGDTIKKIFDPYFTTKPPGEGTGLGLSLCQNLIEAIGGHIAVESEPGKGSKFRVILADKDRRLMKRL